MLLLIYHKKYNEKVYIFLTANKETNKIINFIAVIIANKLCVIKVKSLLNLQYN